MNIVLGVSGGIAAYKACLVLRGLTEAGHDVTVVPTQAALHFVGAATFEALSGHAVRTSVWDDVAEVAHVRLGQNADLVVVVPATADLLARAAHGMADDLLTTTLLTAACPVVMFPAMHTEMWQHPATVDNVSTLRSRGVTVVDPAVGRLTGTDSGPGRLPEPEAILALLRAFTAQARPVDLAGLRVVVSAGGTREPLDPVRYLGNRSSGRQGMAVAAAAAQRGAHVTVVAANVELSAPAGVDVLRVESARDLHESMLKASAEADVVVMAAAVADFRPRSYVTTKIKKSDADGSAPTVELVRNPDILAELVESAHRPRVVVGFAAETGDADGDVLSHGQAKLQRKGCDLLVVNDVGDGRAFGTTDNAAVILSRTGGPVEVAHGPKESLAHVLLDQVVQLLGVVDPT